MKIFIKNMDCQCSRTVVKTEMEKNGIIIKSIDSNEVETEGIISEEQFKLLQLVLLPYGLELLQEKKSRLIEKIKVIITELLNSSEDEIKINLSDYICTKINYSYNYLNKIFKEKTGTTIEKYFISNKIEKVKELLRIDELSLSEIAYMMQYSSLAHLSNQFKKVTGLQPSYFKQFNSKRQEMSLSA